MSNPVLNKWPALTGRGQAGQQSGQQYPTYTQYDPSAFNRPGSYGQPEYPQQPQQQGVWYPPNQQLGGQTWQAPPPAPATQQVMTIDDVLTKTGIVLGSTIMVAIVTIWMAQFLIPDLQTRFTVLAMAGTVSGLATFIPVFIVAIRRKVGPALAIILAITEGVFIGAISWIFEMYYRGIVLQAVVATFVATAITLAAFKYGKFRLSGKVRKILMMCLLGYAGVVLVNLGLSFMGVNLGLFPGPTGHVSGLAWLAALVGVGLAVFALVDDFQFVEEGIALQLPASESWRAAYGLTVTLVWLYVNLLRILSYLRR